jgi:aromatic-L-amino-acid/L-tryptophan decarboxylase
VTEAERSPFDPQLEDIRAMGTSVLDFVARFIDGRYEAPSSDYNTAEALEMTLEGTPPDEGRTLEELLHILETAAAKGFDTAGPGFVAYIPGGGLYSAALADLIACATNRYTGVAAAAPAFVKLEAVVLRWLCNLFDFPRSSQAVFLPGGSVANLSAIVTARATKLGEHFLDGTLYASEYAHHSVGKSAVVAGLPEEAVRAVPVDARMRMDVDALEEMLAGDRAAGRRPFMVVASAGTVSTGAIDPLDRVAALCHAQDLWYHVDGAYGGFFWLTERGRERLRGIQRADSITLDPHKTMFLPYGTGSLIVRDADALKQAHQVQAHYLPASSSDPDLPDFADYTMELTRDFRGLRVWLPLYLHGLNAFRDALNEKLDLAQLVYDELTQHERLEVPWPPELSLVAFRPRSGTDQDALQLLDAINASGRVWLSTALVRGATYLRVCIVSHRTRRARIEECIDIVMEAAARI